VTISASLPGLLVAWSARAHGFKPGRRNTGSHAASTLEGGLFS
jgi:hypothetical protein